MVSGTIQHSPAIESVVLEGAMVKNDPLSVESASLTSDTEELTCLVPERQVYSAEGTSSKPPIHNASTGAETNHTDHTPTRSQVISMVGNVQPAISVFAASSSREAVIQSRVEDFRTEELDANDDLPQWNKSAVTQIHRANPRTAYNDTPVVSLRAEHASTASTTMSSASQETGVPVISPIPQHAAPPNIFGSQSPQPSYTFKSQSELAETAPSWNSRGAGQNILQGITNHVAVSEILAKIRPPFKRTKRVLLRHSKPWSELCGGLDRFGAFPGSLHSWKKQAYYNLRRYQANYFVVSLLILLLCVLTSMTAIIIVAITFGGLLLAASLEKQKTLVFKLSDTYVKLPALPTKVGIAGAGIFLIILFLPGLIFFAVFASALFILIHATFCLPSSGAPCEQDSLSINHPAASIIGKVVTNVFGDSDSYRDASMWADADEDDSDIESFGVNTSSV